MPHFPRSPPAPPRIGNQPPIGDLLAQWLRILVLRRHGIQRIRNSVAFGFAEMIDQQVPCDGSDPSHKRALARVIGIQSPVHLDKNLLGEVLSILRIPGKPVANAINPPVIPLNNLLPSRSIARNTATDQQSDNLGIIQNRLRKADASFSRFERVSL